MVGGERQVVAPLTMLDGARRTMLRAIDLDGVRGENVAGIMVSSPRVTRGFETRRRGAHNGEEAAAVFGGIAAVLGWSESHCISAGRGGAPM